MSELKKETVKQAWGGLLWLRGVLRADGNHKPTVEGRPIEEIIEELGEWILTEEQYK